MEGKWLLNPKDGCVILTTGSQDGNVENSEDNIEQIHLRGVSGWACHQRHQRQKLGTGTPPEVMLIYSAP